MAKKILQWLMVGVAFMVLTACSSKPEHRENNNSQQNKKTITGYVIDDPVIGATIEVYDANGTLLTKEENATDSSGKFSIELNSTKETLIVKAYGGYINNIQFKGSMSFVCNINEKCYITPYTTLLQYYADSLSGSNKLELAKESINELLGISAYPFKNGNSEDIAKFKKAIGDDGSKLLSFVESVYNDGFDGFIDNNTILKYFPNAKKRVASQKNYELDINISQKDKVELVSTSTNQTSNGTSISTKHYLSDVIAFSKVDNNNSILLYHSFNVGKLKNKVNAQTEIAYQVFTNDLNLLLLSNKEKEIVLNKLLKNPVFDKAVKLYNEIINGNSYNENLLDTYIDYLTNDLKKSLNQKQITLNQKLLMQKVAYNTKVNRKQKINISKKLIDGIEDEKTNLYPSKGATNNPFKIMDGLLLNIAYPKGQDYISFDFLTSNALWYAVTSKENYFKTDIIINNLLDPNLISPKIGLINIDSLGRKLYTPNAYVNKYFTWGYEPTSMPIANFDGNLQNEGYENEYVVYRSKPGVYLDAPFIMNALSIADIVIQTTLGVSLTNAYYKKDKKGKETLYQKVFDWRKSLRNNETLNNTIAIFSGIFSFSKEITSALGVKVTDIDQRYGQIETFLNTVKNIIDIDNLDSDKKFDKNDFEYKKIKKIYNEVISKVKKFFTYKNIKQSVRRKKEQIRLNTIVYYYAQHNFMKQILYNLPKKYLRRIDNSSYTYSEIADEYAKFRTCLKNPNMRRNECESEFNLRNNDKLKYGFDAFKNYKKEIKKKFANKIKNADISMKVWLGDIFNIASMANDYLYKLANLTQSIDIDKSLIVIKNLAVQLVKDSLASLKDKAVEVSNDAVRKVLTKAIGGGWVMLAEAGNKAAPMAWDYMTKPVSVSFKIKRNKDYFTVSETVPPVFDNVNYIGIEKDYLLYSTAAKKYNYYRLSYNSVDDKFSSNFLVMRGADFDFNNAAVINDTDLAQSYFEKHEDENAIFTTWHVYRHPSFDAKDLEFNYKATRENAFKNNYFNYSIVGEDLDCIDSLICKDNNKVYPDKEFNPILNDYRISHKKDKLFYFDFDQLWKKAGHRGNGNMTTPGIYSVKSNLYVGVNKEVKYKTAFNIFVATDYDASVPGTKKISHRDKLIEQSYKIIKDKTSSPYALALKLHRTDGFNYYNNWSKAKHGNDFYVYFVAYKKFIGSLKLPYYSVPHPITLGKDSYSYINLNTEPLLQDEEVKNNLDSVDVVVLDSIVHSYLVQNNIHISELLDYRYRREKGKFARPFMIFKLKDLQTKIEEKIEFQDEVKYEMVSNETLTLNASEVSEIKIDDIAQVTWKNDKGDVVGTDNSLTLSNLSVGEHTYTLELTDSNGDEFVYTINISVVKTDLNKGLVAHYEFEGNAKDSSGNGNDGVEHGEIEYIDGVIGKAAKFDGIDDYIDTDGKIPSNITDGKYLTYSAWIKPYSCSSENNLIPIIWDDDWQRGGDRGIGLIKDNNLCKFTIFRKGDGFGDLNSTTPIELNKWQLVTFVLNGEDNKTIYINGVKVGESHIPYKFDHSGRARIVIGSGHDGYVGFFEGLIDDVRIYNRALNEAEIKKLYELGQITQTIDLKKGLVAHYEFEGNAKDSSGNGNDGTEHGGVSYVDGVIGKAAKFDGKSNIKTPIELTGDEKNQYITLAVWGKVEDENHSTFITNFNIGDASNSIILGAKKAGIAGGFNEGDYHSNGFCYKYIPINLIEDLDFTKSNVCGRKNYYYDIYDFGGKPVNYKQWHHYAITYNNLYEKIYIDGKKVVERKLEPNLIGGPNGVSKYTRDDSVYDRFLNIGMYNNTFNYSLSYLYESALRGIIDDVRIYNRALNEAEIKELYKMKK